MDYKRILSLHFTNGMSGREIAAVTGDGKTTVNEFLKRFRECEQFSYPLSENVTNEFIAECLYFRIVTILRSLLNSGEISKNEYTRAKAYYKKLTGADMVIAG